MHVQKISSPNFGMALKCDPKLSQIQFNIALKHGARKAIKADEILLQLEQNKALTNLYLEGNWTKAKLIAVVGDKIFKENFFNSPYRVLKKALKESNKVK